MTFASARTDGGLPIVIGNRKMTRGTYTNSDGGTGGDIDTGMTVCENLFMQTSGAAVAADDSSINETLPCDGSAVTVVNVANADGTWMAIGY